MSNGIELDPSGGQQGAPVKEDDTQSGERANGIRGAAILYICWDPKEGWEERWRWGGGGDCGNCLFM